MNEIPENGDKMIKRENVDRDGAKSDKIAMETKMDDTFAATTTAVVSNGAEDEFNRRITPTPVNNGLDVNTNSSLSTSTTVQATDKSKIATDKSRELTDTSSETTDKSCEVTDKIQKDAAVRAADLQRKLKEKDAQINHLINKLDSRVNVVSVLFHLFGCFLASLYMVVSVCLSICWSVSLLVSQTVSLT